MAVVRGLATALFILSIPLALITSNVRYLTNEKHVYEYAIDHYDAAATTGIARNELLRASGELRNYFNNDSDVFFTRVEKNNREIALFNERETEHLKDVKGVLQVTYLVQELALVYIMAYVVGVFVWARERSMRTLAIHTLVGGLLAIGVIAAFAVIAAGGFESAFEQFHEIAFTNDLWQLNPATDRLIMMFPEGFWFDVTIFLGVLTIGEAVVLSLGSAIHLTFGHRTTKQALMPGQDVPSAQAAN